MLYNSLPGIFSAFFAMKKLKQITYQNLSIPFWAIILVSALGTFMSVYFANELVDIVKHEEREKYKKHAHKH